MVDKFIESLKVFLRVPTTNIVEKTKQPILQYLFRWIFTQNIDNSKEIALSSILSHHLSTSTDTSIK
jgi:hypothetical protein